MAGSTSKEASPTLMGETAETSPPTEGITSKPVTGSAEAYTTPMHEIAFKAAKKNIVAKNRKRKLYKDTPNLEVNCYVLELTLKSTFPNLDEHVPEKPIFGIHSLNPANNKNDGKKVEQICNRSKPPVQKNFSVINYPEMVIYWPNLSGPFGSYHSFWKTEKHKHGSKALFKEDFLDTGLRLGKHYMLKILKFMAENGYGKNGIYNCGQFQMILNKSLGFEAVAVFGWEGRTMPKTTIKLYRVDILLSQGLIPKDYNITRNFNLDTTFFELHIPDIIKSDYEF